MSGVIDLRDSCTYPNIYITLSIDYDWTRDYMWLYQSLKRGAVKLSNTECVENNNNSSLSFP